MAEDSNSNSEEVVLRVMTTGGRSRIVLSSKSCLRDLREQIEKQTNVPVSQQKLSLDESGSKALCKEDGTLKQLGLSSGSVVYLKSDVSPSLKIHSISPAKQMSTADLPAVSASPATQEAETKTEAPEEEGGDQGSPRGGKRGFHKGDEKEPTFKSFDAFLKERGYNSNDLPCKASFKPSSLIMGRLNKVPPTVTLKHQAYRHVDHLELMNVDEVKGFVNYWRYELDMCQQRGGWMYGYYKEDHHYPLGIRAVCETIYEPPQISSGGGVQFLADADLERADRIAAKLGIERIGWMFTHLPRDELLTADEVVQAARFQWQGINENHFTKYPVAKFVTCTITPDAKNGGEPVPNAFMVSDMGMALVRDSLVTDVQPDTTHIMLRKPEHGELLPQVLESGAETEKFDADWFVVRVNESAPIKVRSLFRSNTKFPVENRMVAQQPAHLKTYFNSFGQIPASDNWQKFTNFHLLLYVSKLFDIETSLSIAECIANQTVVDQGLEDILKSIA
eukprot:GHVS01107663.1.p1 GENE.GHVS01107663.1~~GHVS01107663.1.p1  ORF type:complete len:524 (-),score=85.76 GHVS01107663.1:236-1753(-)